MCNGSLERLDGVDAARLSKEHLCLGILFPPFYMGRHPSASILGVSNTTELAERFSRRARNIVASPSRF